MIVSREKVDLASPKRVYSHLSKILSKLDKIEREKEHFYVITLNSRNRARYTELIAVGTLDACLVHPREVFRRAIHNGASSIIIAHNHPSGNTEKSDGDIETTKRMAQVGKLIGIEVVDHIIIGNGFFSFNDNNLM